MKSNRNYKPLKLAACLIAAAIVLRSETCNKDEMCISNPNLTVTTKRTQLWTEFTISGTGFGPNSNIKASVHNQPPGLPTNQDLGSVVTANGNFSITWHPEGGYLSMPVNSDVQPYFTATDQKGCLASTNTVSSAYWY